MMLKPLFEIGFGAGLKPHVQTLSRRDPIYGRNASTSVIDGREKLAFRPVVRTVVIRQKQRRTSPENVSFERRFVCAVTGIGVDTTVHTLPGHVSAKTFEISHFRRLYRLTPSRHIRADGRRFRQSNHSKSTLVGRHPKCSAHENCLIYRETHACTCT